MSKRVEANDYNPIDEQRKRKMKIAYRTENSLSSENEERPFISSVCYMHMSILIDLNCVRIRSTRNISGAGGSAVLVSRQYILASYMRCETTVVCGSG